MPCNLAPYGSAQFRFKAFMVLNCRVDGSFAQKRRPLGIELCVQGIYPPAENYAGGAFQDTEGIPSIRDGP